MSEIRTSPDPRVSRTIALLEHSLLELLEEEKLHRITVQSIAKRAGVNRATFYAHFYDKYALYRQLIRTTFLERVHEHVGPEESLSRETLPLLVSVVLDYFAYLNTACPPSDRELRPMAEVEIQRVLMKMFKTLTAPAGEHATRFVAWGLFGIGIDTISTETTENRAALVSQITKLILGALDATALPT